jgi:hypothetical protein
LVQLFVKNIIIAAKLTFCGLTLFIIYRNDVIFGTNAGSFISIVPVPKTFGTGLTCTKVSLGGTIKTRQPGKYNA